ncbi:MAG: glycosyltransferase [Anaerolineae bacterium]|nr:glycosyltransferase [Anaerolineae bacterium]
MSERRVAHQFLEGATTGDAVSDHAFDIQRWLREWGYDSSIYAWHSDGDATDRVLPLSAYRRSGSEQFAIYHHSTGSESAEFLLRHQLPLVLIYHNMTPPAFLRHVDAVWQHAADKGMRQLLALRPQTMLALGVSLLNQRELAQLGFTNTDILPIALNEADYDFPDDLTTVEALAGQETLLFVGRFAPNKRQEDLVKLLALVCRIRPNAQLALVGDPWTVGYADRVRQMAATLGVADRILLPGKVSRTALTTYYRHAVLYVSMSEHEGFGKPFIESMYFGLPFLAFGAEGVVETVGDAGVLFVEKDFGRIAATVDLLIDNDAIRSRLQLQQKQRVQQFLAPTVATRLRNYLTTLENR